MNLASAALLLACCAWQLSAVGGAGKDAAPCVVVTSLLELPDLQTCRQLLALAEDPWQGCPALRPVADPASAVNSLHHDEAAELDTADAKDLGDQLGDPDTTEGTASTADARASSQPTHNVLASQLCCTAAKLFVALRCHCWTMLDANTVAYLTDQAKLCGPLPQAAEAVNPVDSLTKSGQQLSHGDNADAADLQRLWRQRNDAELSKLAARSRLGDLALPSKRDATGRALSAVRVIAAVITSAGDRSRRDAIRATWGSDKRLHRLLFVSAMPRTVKQFDELRLEAVLHHDLVILPHILEAYGNITHQTFEACRIAAADPDMTHLLKADDDVFVRVGPLLNRISGMPLEYALAGSLEYPGGKPNRDTTSKWHVTKKEWPSNRYPPWAHGPGYVLTADLVREVAAGAALKPQQPLFKLEDVAMGSWLEHIAQERDIQISYVRERRFNYAGCSHLDIVSHYINEGLMYCMWANGGECCTEHGEQAFEKQLKKVGGDAAQMRDWRPPRLSQDVWLRQQEEESGWW